MGDLLTAWLRTVVPGIWSAGVTWLVAHVALPAGASAALMSLGEMVIFPLVLAAVYAVLRKLEPHLPAWLARLLIGSTKQPSYPTPPG